MMFKKIVFASVLTLAAQITFASEMVANSESPIFASTEQVNKNIAMLSAQEMSSTKGRYLASKVSLIPTNCYNCPAPVTNVVAQAPVPISTTLPLGRWFIRLW